MKVDGNTVRALCRIVLNPLFVVLMSPFGLFGRVSFRKFWENEYKRVKRNRNSDGTAPEFAIRSTQRPQTVAKTADPQNSYNWSCSSKIMFYKFLDSGRDPDQHRNQMVNCQ